MADHGTSGTNIVGTVAVVLLNLITAQTRSDILFFMSLTVSLVAIAAHVTTIRKNTKKQ